MNFGVCVLVLNSNGELLSVSRKHDKNDLGLPGGKVEPGETPVEAAGRELLEETGYKILDVRYSNLIYHNEHNGRLTVVYEVPFGALKQVETPKEAGVVAWVKPDALANGKTFGEFNRGLFKTIGLKLAPAYGTYAGYDSYGNSGLEKALKKKAKNG